MGATGSYAPRPRRQERATGVTDATGNVTFTWPVGAFTTPPVVSLAVQAGTGFRSARIAANTALVTTVNVLQSASVTVLGIGVLATGGPAVGVTVHATATAA